MRPKGVAASGSTMGESVGEQKGCVQNHGATHDSVQVGFHQFFLWGCQRTSNTEGGMAYIEVDLVKVAVGPKYDVHVVQAGDLRMISVLSTS